MVAPNLEEGGMNRDAANNADGCSEIERVLITLAAMVEGDRALNVEAAALLLAVPVGKFRQLSARPRFPTPAKMGKRLTWRRRELLDWWDAERDRQNRGLRAA